MSEPDALLAAAEPVSEEELRRERLPGHQVLAWSVADASLADVLRHLALDKLPWLASIEGRASRALGGPDDVGTLRTRTRTLLCGGSR